LYPGRNIRGGISHPQRTYICRVQSNIWRLPKYWPSTPSPPSECVHPPHQRREVHTRRAVRGWGINILEDVRHWIGLLQYNPSTIRPDDLLYDLPGNVLHPDERGLVNVHQLANPEPGEQEPGWNVSKVKVTATSTVSSNTVYWIHRSREQVEFI